METKTCKACLSEVQKAATKCAHCGQDLRKFPIGQAVAAVLILAIAIILILAFTPWL